MSELVSASAPGGGFNWEDHKGALLLIEPLALEHDVKTTFGLKNAVRANIYVLDGPNQGEEAIDALIFPTLLVSQTKGNVGAKVVGRLGTGNQKVGQKAPWLLAEATADDLAKAQAWVTARTSPALASARPPF